MTSLLAQYNNNIASYEAITGQFQSMLSLLLQNQSLHIHSISGRTKDQLSLANKITRHNNKYRRLDDITDLCGIRIITYYEDEVDKIAAFIRKNFSIDKENSIDKRQKLAPDQFGYTSLHLIVNLPINAKGICRGACEKICKVEVQIRSILQHAWAEIEHDLEYKNPSGTSRQIRRHLSRRASLLELADEEFRGIRDEVDAAPEKSLPTAAKPAVYQAADAAASPAASPAIKTPANGIIAFLREFPNAGWAAFVTVLFFVLAFLADWYFGTKITHLAMEAPTQLPPV